MRKSLALMAIVLTVGMTAALDAEARRLGGRSAGMQRQPITAPAKNTAAPATPASPTQAAPVAGAAAAPAAAATATKRSWMGPIAGLAAGLGIAALASHFGFGEALANMLTMALVAMLVLGFIAFVMRKRMAAQGALARTGDAGPVRSPMLGTGIGSGIGSGIGAGIGSGLAETAAAPVGAQPIPADFDKAGFERTARDQFARLQAANDARDLDRLRDYLSPEMFDIVRAEIAERGDAPQRTETFGLEAQVLEVAEEADRYVVSVRFTGSVREQAGREIEDLDEVWHLTKPKSGFGGWVIAGIQQSA